MFFCLGVTHGTLHVPKQKASCETVNVDAQYWATVRCELTETYCLNEKQGSAEQCRAFHIKRLKIKNSKRIHTCVCVEKAVLSFNLYNLVHMQPPPSV